MASKKKVRTRGPKCPDCKCLVAVIANLCGQLTGQAPGVALRDFVSEIRAERRRRARRARA